MTPAQDQDNTRAKSPVKGSLRAHLIKGAAGSFVLQIGFAGFAFLNAIILARVLGPAGYGTFANAMAWVSLLTIPAAFGFGILLVRDVAIFRSQEKWGLLKGLLRFSNRFVIIFSLLLAVLAAIAANFIFSAPDQAVMRQTIWIALLLLPLFSLYSLREAALRGLEHVILARLPGMLVRPGLLLAGIVALYLFWPDNLSAPMVMAVNVGAGIVTLGLGMVFLARLLPRQAKTTTATYNVKPWMKAAFPMLIYGGAQIILGQTDIVMLGAMRGAEEVGLYAAASRLSFMLTYAMMASNMILAPVMARLYANGEIEKLQKIITKAVRIAFFAILPIGLVLMFKGDFVLSLFGGKFVAAKAALLILSTGRLLDAGVGIGTGLLVLTAAGYERVVASILLFAVVANVSLNTILIPAYGMGGAAIASIISLLAGTIVLAVISYKKIGVGATIFGGQKVIADD